MFRPILPLVLLLAACGQNTSMQMPRFELQPPPLVAPRGAQADQRFQACRTEATRVVMFRERGQTMRNDDLAMAPGSFGNDSAVPDWRRQMNQSNTDQEIDRLTRQCIASNEAQPAAAAAR
ncbi:hypothetical protein [Falsiroseomonas sp. HW251]|uniref:hypothetical protein n=1 Tax=Falsiroseomonas sp. HW251 TaxID=3390998 RepID=UPI003D314598